MQNETFTRRIITLANEGAVIVNRRAIRRCRKNTTSSTITKHNISYGHDLSCSVFVEGNVRNVILVTRLVCIFWRPRVWASQEFYITAPIRCIPKASSFHPRTPRILQDSVRSPLACGRYLINKRSERLVVHSVT